VLNARLYRTCWLVAGVALVVALLTLQTPEPGADAPLPSAIDGQGTLVLAGELAGIAPERTAGSGPDQAAARWVQDQFAQVPGESRPQVQELEARDDGEPVQMRNVYLAVPGAAGRPRGGIVVIAPRDTPSGVRAGASATAVLLRLANASATTRHTRPHLFVSTDGSTVGNAGVRWFLERFSAFPITAAIVLDAPGEANGDRIHVWTAGRIDRQALGLGHIAERAIERAGGRADGMPSLTSQLMRLAVPQTFGDQGATIADGIPAVTLSNRGESPLRPDREPTEERLALVANAANNLLGALDAAPTVPAADGTLAFAGKFLRPTVARLALLLLALPVLVATLDIVARRRRQGIPLGDGVRAVGVRAIPIGVAVIVAHLLALGGLLPGAAAGAPPLPSEARFGALAGLAIAIAAAAAALSWASTRRRARRIGAPPAAESAAALAVISALLIALWILSPFALALALPAAHAALLAPDANRPWHLPALAALALLPILLLAVTVAGVLNSNPFFAVWYLIDTVANGSRGGTGPLVAVLFGAALWSIIALTGARAMKGGFGGGRARRRPRRPARPRPPARLPRARAGRE
jgi:hypothetical protein